VSATNVRYEGQPGCTGSISARRVSYRPNS